MHEHRPPLRARAWLRKVFTVMGGFLAETGILALLLLVPALPWLVAFFALVTSARAASP